MIKYICADLLAAMEYLPYGLALGIPVALLFLWVSRRKGGRGEKEGAARFPVAVYAVYFAILLVITFFSRESGSRRGGMDLELLSTWGINDRNNAYVVENVLLFVPYGFLCSWAFPWARNFFACTLFGAATSVLVECLQLVTARGYFQIDDILTNILGTAVGFLLYLPVRGRRN